MASSGRPDRMLSWLGRPLAARRWALAWLSALAVLAIAPSVATADPTISFVLPPGAHGYPYDGQAIGDWVGGYDQAPTALRTTDPRPRIGIEASAGTRFVCHPDSVWVDEPCGAPEPGCTAAVCASYQPAAPWAPPDPSGLPDDHFLAVDLLDSDGDTLASWWLKIDFDSTPPAPTVDSARGVLEPSNLNPFRPRFHFAVGDDNSVGGNVDRAECSWTAAAVSPRWRGCTPGTGTSTPPTLPRRHRLYRFEVRATDDFGRSTTASAVYDPRPCTVSVRHPVGLRRFIASGLRLPVHLVCDAARTASVAVFVLKVSGQRGISLHRAVAGGASAIAQLTVHGHGRRISVRRRLRLPHSRADRAQLRRLRSLRLGVAAGATNSLESGAAAAVTGRSFTVRR